MAELTSFCMCATTFKPDGSIDEKAFRKFLRRIVNARLDLYVGSGGSGESHAMSLAEQKQVYEIAVDECGDQVQVHANPPEKHTVKDTVEHALIAAKAGIHVIHMYTLAGAHGMKPTDAELTAYYDEVLKRVRHPVAIAVNPTMGYIPKPALMADIANRHKQVVAVKLTGVQDTYLIDVKGLIKREMSYYVQPQGSINAFVLGADGVFGSEGNIMPKTVRAYIDAYKAKNYRKLGETYEQIRKFNQYVNKWGPSNPRWLKIAMHVLKLPGWEGGVREPYRLPEKDELKRFADGLVRLRIPEVNVLARKAGLRVPV